MPGVPAGKGCEACRRGRKKCDERQPRCLRCTRLGLHCVGSGKQRYVFRPVAFPTTAPSRLTANFVAHLHRKDVRYDLLWTFGDILQDVPARLGTHDALDAAANAVVATSPCLLAQEAPTARMRAAYVAARRRLRLAVAGPGGPAGGGWPVEMWLAVFLLWVCQGWFGLIDDIDPGHAQGLLRLWGALAPGSFGSLDAFHRRVICTLLMPVILEGLFDPTIVLSPSVWTLARDLDVAIAGDGIVARFLRSADTCTPLTSQLWVAHCGLRIQDVLTHHHTHRREASALRSSGQQLLAWLRRRIDSPDPPIHGTPHQHAEDLRTYSFTAAFLLLLNAAPMPPHLDSARDPLAQQTHLINDLMRKARLAQQYRPLGGLGATWALLIAWASLPEVSSAVTKDKKAEIRAMLFECDVVGINARTDYMMRQARDMFARLELRQCEVVD